MTRGEITGKKPAGTDPNKQQPVPTLAMSIPQFCIAHNIQLETRHERGAPGESACG